MSQRIRAVHVAYWFSVAVGAIWWLVIARRAPSVPSRAIALLTVVLAIQIVALVTTFHALRRARTSGIVLAVITLCLVLGNALFYITPVMGAPVLAAVVVATIFLLRARRGAAA